jgi:hypothetical protein
MRRYDIVFGIFLILSIINFALTAPVPVQEKLHARVDAMYIPKDVITVLEKRGIDGLDGKLAKVAADYVNLIKAVESSDAHASSSSAPPRPDHGSKTDMPAPAPIPASSTTANPDLLIEPSSLSLSLTTSSTAGGDSNYDDFVKTAKEFYDTRRKAYLEKQKHAATISALPGLDRISTTYPKLLMNPASSLSSTAPGMDATLQDKWWHDGPHGPTYTPMSLGDGSDHVSTGVHAPQPNPNPRPSYNPYFAWNFVMTVKNPPPLPVTPASLIQFGQTHASENQVEHVEHPDTGPSTDLVL